MLSPGEDRGRRWWGVVISAAENRRVRKLALRVFDRQRPQQYCLTTGGRTLIEHSVSQVASVVSSQRIITVIGNGHKAYLHASRLPGRVLEEPANRGTGASVFLPLVYVLAEEPDATVLVLPCDQFATQDENLVPHLERAGTLAELMPGRLVVLTAVPSRPESEFGWVEAGPVLDKFAGFGARSVKKFYEQPGQQDAESFFRRGFFWNTMIMAVKARTLWTIGQELFPGMMKRFQNLLDLLKLVHSGNASPDLETLALRDVYRGLETVNFARRVFQQTPEWVTLLPITSLTWRDWGHSAEADDREQPSTHVRPA